VNILYAPGVFHSADPQSFHRLYKLVYFPVLDRVLFPLVAARFDHHADNRSGGAYSGDNRGHPA
jgi:hypothetical protein